MVDITIISGERYLDHPLCGLAIVKRLLEKKGYSVNLVELPTENDIKAIEAPKLFFAVTSGSMDSMVRNYTPMKRKRENAEMPDRAVIVYCNWLRYSFKDSVIVLGGVEPSLRRFVHYDYWDNNLRKPILFDSRATILAYGFAEKQMLEIADRLQHKKDLVGIEGTCIISKELPKDFILLPSFEEVVKSKEKFCEMQNHFDNDKNLAQKIDNRYALQFSSPRYLPKDLDEYYELPFTRDVPKELRGFQFSVVTHRGCIGDCNFCSITLTQGKRIVSRSEASIVKEIQGITKLPFFKGNIDDLGGPSANMYGMDCCRKNSDCMTCPNLDRSNKRMIGLLKKVRGIAGVKNVYIRSGVRYDLASDEYMKEVAEHHIYDTLRIAPEHVSKNVLKLMNKDFGNLKQFVDKFEALKSGKQLSYYFMTAHPGSSMKEADELALSLKKLKNAEAVQVFTPTPMTASTCMYYTGIDPKTGKKIYIPYTYSEKKKQKRVIFIENPDEMLL